MHNTRQTVGVTDRQTDGRNCYQYLVCIAAQRWCAISG